MKTALETGGLAARWLAPQMLGLRPQRVANGPSSGGASSADRGDLDAPIDDRALEFHREALRCCLFRRFRHRTQYETSGSPAQVLPSAPGRRINPEWGSSKSLFYRRKPTNTDPPGMVSVAHPAMGRDVAHLARTSSRHPMHRSWSPSSPRSITGVSQSRCGRLATRSSFGCRESSSRGAFAFRDQAHPLQPCFDRAQRTPVLPRDFLRRLPGLECLGQSIVFLPGPGLPDVVGQQGTPLSASLRPIERRHGGEQRTHDVRPVNQAIRR